MKDRDSLSTAPESAEQAAARWALRCAEGLDAREELELADWLAADAQHARLLAEYRAAWDRFEPLSELGAAPREVAARPPATGRGWRVAAPLLAAAAAIAVGLWWRAPRAPAPVVAATTAARPVLPPPCEQRTLADGTIVELNRGAELAVTFTPGERRVRLVRGEASFTVTKDPARPFIVAAGELEARAVGTAFTVRHDAAAVEVVVTEGLVQVDATPAAAAGAPVMLGVGQQVLVAGVGAPGSAVRTLTPSEIEQRLAWQSRLLEFDDAPLQEIVAAFNRRNPVRLVVSDPELAAQRMTATFRSDNVESFVRLLETNFGVRVRASSAGEIELGRR